MSVEGWIAVFTGGLIIVGFIQALIYRAMHRTTKAVERAWISLETLEVEPSPTAGNQIIFIGLKNSGRTPARIVRANVTLRSTTSAKDEGGGTVIQDLADLPDDPDYDRGVFVPPAILVAGETTRWKHEVSVPTDDAWNLLTTHPGEPGRFWIYGFVEYTDQFHPRKTRTYKWGREYDPVLSKIHGRFKFAHMGKPKYSYAD